MESCEEREKEVGKGTEAEKSWASGQERSRPKWLAMAGVWPCDGEQGRCGLGPWGPCPTITIRLPVPAALAGRQAGRQCGQHPNLRGPRTCWSIFRVREALARATDQPGWRRDRLGLGLGLPPLLTLFCP